MALPADFSDLYGVMTWVRNALLMGKYMGFTYDWIYDTALNRITVVIYTRRSS